jgi:flagellar P-ring protein precursor FlgI
MAHEISSLIKERVFYTETGGEESGEKMVKALDATNILVRIPKSYAKDPVFFASELLETPIVDPQTESRVVINTRAGTIVISGDVEIGDVVVTHKSVVVDATQTDAFMPIDLDNSGLGTPEGAPKPKLQTLVDQLNALKVPTSDMIEIICGIERNGKLHGKLIIDR